MPSSAGALPKHSAPPWRRTTSVAPPPPSSPWRRQRRSVSFRASSNTRLPETGDRYYNLARSMSASRRHSANSVSAQGAASGIGKVIKMAHIRRAVIYARYSSENQRDASIDDQIRNCTAFIERQGWQLVSNLHRSGDQRRFIPSPGLSAGSARGAAAAFDVVVAEALDRVSRDQADTATFYKHLSFHGIQLVTLAEGRIDELHVGLKGTMNALYLKDLAMKTRRGLEGRVRDGRSGGRHLLMATRWCAQLGSDGRPVCRQARRQAG